MSKEESRKGMQRGAPIEKITHTCKFCGADVMDAIHEYQEPQAHNHKATKDTPIDATTNTSNVCGADVVVDIPKDAKIEKITNTCKFCGADVMVAIQEYEET